MLRRKDGTCPALPGNVVIRSQPHLTRMVAISYAGQARSFVIRDKGADIDEKVLPDVDILSVYV